MEINDSVVAGGIVTAAVGIFGWLFKLVARQSVAQINASLAMHAQVMKGVGDDVRSLSREVNAMQIELAGFRERIKRVEGIIRD